MAHVTASRLPITKKPVGELVSTTIGWSVLQIEMQRIVSTYMATQLTKPNGVGHTVSIACRRTLTTSKHNITQQ